MTTFAEFLANEEACSTGSVGNTPGDNAAFGDKSPKGKMARRKPVVDENTSSKILTPSKGPAMKSEELKIGDRVSILKEGFSHGRIVSINEEDGSLVVDPNSRLVRGSNLAHVVLGESEVELYVSLKTVLLNLQESLQPPVIAVVEDAAGEVAEDDAPAAVVEDEAVIEADIDPEVADITFELDSVEAVTESTIKAIAVRLSMRSDLSIQEAIEKVTTIAEAYDWDDAKLQGIFSDKKKWAALKTNRPDLAGKMKEIETKNAKPAAVKPAAVDNSGKIAQMIDAAIGQVYPDGDPLDYLLPKLKAMGIAQQDAMKQLDNAAKKHLKAKSFNAHVADAWDQHNDDGGNSNTNPWK